MLTKKQSRIGVIITLLSAASFARTAQADWTLCNRSGDKVEVAIGVDTDAGTRDTRGWYSFRPGECRKLLAGHESFGPFYYAQSGNGGVWEGGPGHGNRLCIYPGKKFDLTRADDLGKCHEIKGLTDVWFKAVDYDFLKYNDFTTNLTNSEGAEPARPHRGERID